jgi:hypothetical protein
MGGVTPSVPRSLLAQPVDVEAVVGAELPSAGEVVAAGAEVSETASGCPASDVDSAADPVGMAGEPALLIRPGTAVPVGVVVAGASESLVALSWVALSWVALSWVALSWVALS